jgi:hypothetical protein
MPKRFFLKNVVDTVKVIAVLHQKGGKSPKLAVEDKLYITLKYLWEYRMMDSIADEYGVCKDAVCLSVQWVDGGFTE